MDSKDREAFRSALGDLKLIATKFAEHVKDVKDLVEIIDLATTNDGQLSLTMSVIYSDKVVRGKL